MFGRVDDRRRINRMAGGQWREWTETECLDWHLLESRVHRGVQLLVQDLNKLYQKPGALWEAEAEASGFQWIEVDNAFENVLACRQISPSNDTEVLCVA